MEPFYKTKWFYLIVLVVLLLASAIGVWWYRSQAELNAQLEELEQVQGAFVNEPIQPIPLHLELDEQKVNLGEQLFHDTRFSSDNSISCSTCHQFEIGGVDRLPRSIGINNQEGIFNTPTVFNSGFNFRQFWDGRAATLEEQIDGPIQTDHEMASSWPEIIGKLKEDATYTSQFDALYTDGITSDNVKDAIATFERSLYTPNSRFDQFLRGNDEAITLDEKKGYELFKGYGCISCHQGMNVGGNIYQKFGVVGDYFADRGNITDADLGRYNITGNELDRHVFKVPSLRNVAITPPYFHDASAQKLEQAVATMGKYQLGRPLSDEDVRLIVGFLKTLTGEYKGVSLESQIP